MKLYASEAEKLRAEMAAAEENRPTMKVSCLGPMGSYSDYAAREMCKGYEVVFCPSFAAAVEKLLNGEVDYCVLPVDNSINGGVKPVLDLLAAEPIFGDEEYAILADQRLAMLAGTREEDITTICSHELLFGQCEQYIRAKFPNITLLPARSAEESLVHLDGHTACIVGARFQRDGIILSSENIADVKPNLTRFMRLKRTGGMPADSAMLFVCAVCMHKPGSLLGLLRIFQRQSLNLTRIESRPMKDSFGEYRFFIEFAGDIGSERVRSALKEAANYCSQFKLIGAYH